MRPDSRFRRNASMIAPTLCGDRVPSGLSRGMRLTSSPSRGSRLISAAPLLSSAWSMAVVIGALLVVFELDRTTGSTPVQHLYYLPLIFAGVSFGMGGGLVAALAVILLYHLANPHLFTFRYEESDLVQIVLFIAVSVITAKLTRDARRLHALAMTDDLTGLHNLRSFESRLATIVRTSREARTPVAFLVLDVDRLKRINDTYGHLAGAEAVRTVGHIIGASLPSRAVACRYGGDEFVIALPRCAEAQARATAEELCRNVNAAAPILAGFLSQRGPSRSALAWRAVLSIRMDTNRPAGTINQVRRCFVRPTPRFIGPRKRVAITSSWLERIRANRLQRFLVPSQGLRDAALPDGRRATRSPAGTLEQQVTTFSPSPAS